MEHGTDGNQTVSIIEAIATALEADINKRYSEFCRGRTDDYLPMPYSFTVRCYEVGTELGIEPDSLNVQKVLGLLKTNTRKQYYMEFDQPAKGYISVIDQPHAFYNKRSNLFAEGPVSPSASAKVVPETITIPDRRPVVAV